MATLTVVKGSVDGVDPNASMATAASGGDEFKNDGRTYAYVKNGHASASRTVTIPWVVDKAIVITAQNAAVIGPIPIKYNDDDGNVQLTYSDSGADITLKVISML